MSKPKGDESMIIQMKTGLNENSPEVEAVITKAKSWKVTPEVEKIKGSNYDVISIRLYDGINRSNIIPEYVFELMDGVSDVIRVTPPEISLTYNGQQDAKVIQLTPEINVCNYLPCRLVFGPCTVDKYVDQVIGLIASHGLKMVRGGCWKPRSSPYSFPGHGEKAVEWLLSAAKKHRIECVFLEVMESEHINIVRKVQKLVGYEGNIVLWVGARTRNSILLRTLGIQTDYPVILKHPLSATSPEVFTKDSEWVVNGPAEFDDDGQMIKQASSKSGNHNLMLCLRGLEGGVKPWRFRPNWDWAEHIRENWWTPVVIDPSHAAGTTENDLVFTSIDTALIHDPAIMMIEGGYPECGVENDSKYRGLCDMAQSISIEKLPVLIKKIRQHNISKYNLDVF